MALCWASRSSRTTSIAQGVLSGTSSGGGRGSSGRGRGRGSRGRGRGGARHGSGGCSDYVVVLAGLLWWQWYR